MISSKKAFSTPKAPRQQHKMRFLGEHRYDPYYWLRDRENQEKKVLSYLKAENDYVEKKLTPVKKLRQKLFKEMKERIPKKDSSVPFQKEDFYYYTRYEVLSEYPIICRKKNSLQAKEEVILNANELAKNQDYFELGDWDVNKDQDLLAYTVDVKGRRFYTLFIKDLKTKKVIHVVRNISSNFIWSKKNPYVLLYTLQNKKTLRWEQIKALNVTNKKHKLIYHEKDKKHNVYVLHSLSKDFIFIKSYSKESTKVFFLPSSTPMSSAPRLFEKRREGHEYEVEYAGSYFFILSNLKGKNFQIFRTPDRKKTSAKHWKSFIPHRREIFIQDFLVFKTHLVLLVRKNGFREIEMVPRKEFKEKGNKTLTKKMKDPFFIPLPETNHFLSFGTNVDNRSPFLRFSYSSMKTPLTTMDFYFDTRKIKIKKVQKVLKDFKKDNYISKRLFAPAPDGEKIPISLIYHKTLNLNGKNPTLLYGYGSYGYSLEPYFRSHRLSLLKRGFVFALAHIRGGSEKGRKWYEDGKRLKKKNTFQDFISCAEFLIQKKYTSPSSLYIMGGSAGGLLIGAVLNQRPDLFYGAIAHVPFVDVLTTMLDEDIPLTTEEYEEWGNPNQKKYYSYIKSYSPYDNIKAQNYPHLLITAGFHDSQVQYWEAAKWAAKLRHLKTDQNLLLLETNMKAGHSGRSGRFNSLKDLSRDYAFLLMLEKKLGSFLHRP